MEGVRAAVPQGDPGWRDEEASRMSILSGKLGLTLICVLPTECAHNWN
jgi:hypothetical protein